MLWQRLAIQVMKSFDISIWHYFSLCEERSVLNSLFYFLFSLSVKDWLPAPWRGLGQEVDMFNDCNMLLLIACKLWGMHTNSGMVEKYNKMTSYDKKHFSKTLEYFCALHVLQYWSSWCRILVEICQWFGMCGFLALVPHVWWLNWSCHFIRLYLD